MTVRFKHFVILLIFAVGTPCFAQETIRSFSEFAGQTATPVAINNNGDIVGFASADISYDGTPVFVRTAAGAIIPVEVNGGTVISRPVDINDSGNVLFSNKLWTGNSLTNIDASSIAPQGVNDAVTMADKLTNQNIVTGQLFGQFQNGGTFLLIRPFAWNNGTAISTPNTIDTNNFGDQLLLRNGEYFYSLGGSEVRLPLTSSDNPDILESATYLSATLINDQAQVAGVYRRTSVAGEFGFTYDAINGFQSFGVPGIAEMVIYGMNNKREVVGAALKANGETAGFIFIPGIGFRFLDQYLPAGSGWEGVAALDINDRSELIGRGRLNGTFNSFYFAHSASTPAPPEPQPETATKVNIGVSEPCLTALTTSGVIAAGSACNLAVQIVNDANQSLGGWDYAIEYAPSVLAKFETLKSARSLSSPTFENLNFTAPGLYRVSARQNPSGDARVYSPQLVVGDLLTHPVPQIKYMKLTLDKKCAKTLKSKKRLKKNTSCTFTVTTLDSKKKPLRNVFLEIKVGKKAPFSTPKGKRSNKKGQASWKVKFKKTSAVTAQIRSLITSQTLQATRAIGIRVK